MGVRDGVCGDCKEWTTVEESCCGAPVLVDGALVEPEEAELRPFGEILLDLEVLLLEMIDGHDVQLGDLLNLVRGYVEVHRPSCIEEYEDGTHPEFFYGPKEAK